jgi:hypothetical protein
MLNAESHYRLCFDLEKDFDSEGNVKAVAGVRVPVKSLDDLHAFVVMDVDSATNLKGYILKQKARCEAKK